MTRGSPTKDGPGYAAFSDQLATRIRAGEMPVDGQQKREPLFYVTTTQGMSGWFAVMVWDGMGFEECYETGEGRYGEPEPAQCEAREWAAAENIEYRA